MSNTEFCHLNETSISLIKASNQMDSTLLITGSTGTGKSYLAKIIHEFSLRRLSGKFHKINLATLSENIIESELFGHEKGAFTGAETRRVGKLEICNGGTVFLDEIGELSLRLQAKLLDFIQYKKITPVGGNREIELDVRIIAATNKNLEHSVKLGEFRADLFHRLNIFHVRLADLALTPKSILPLAEQFLKIKNAKAKKNIIAFSFDVQKLLRAYSWPGNIRELENTIEYAVAIEKTDEIRLQSLPHELQSLNNEISDEVSEAVEETVLKITSQVQLESAIATVEIPITLDFHQSKDSFEKIYLEQALKLCSGQINLTSKRIGLSKVSLSDKIKRYSIDWKKIRLESMANNAANSFAAIQVA